MKKRNWLFALTLGVLASGAPVAVGAVTFEGPGTSAQNLTNVSNGFELADDNSSVQANSIAEFDLTPGTLALIAVPNIYFKSDSVANLITGTPTLETDMAAATPNSHDFDGNDEQTISVHDYRGNNAGWRLSGSLGDFSSGSTNVTATSITLAGTTTGDNTADVALSSANFAGGHEASLLTAPQGEGAGDTEVKVTSGKLALAQNTKAVVGTYQATVNWQLIAQPTPAADPAAATGE